MPNNLRELEVLLEAATPQSRSNLCEIISGGFGDSPSSLCDHLCFLRSGPIGQLLDSRDYKQLVTDVADIITIDWKRVVGSGSWADLSAEEIEGAIVWHVGCNTKHIRGVRWDVPGEAMAAFKFMLVRSVRLEVPKNFAPGPNRENPLYLAFSPLPINWRKLLAAIIYVQKIIRLRTVSFVRVSSTTLSPMSPTGAGAVANRSKMRHKATTPIALPRKARSRKVTMDVYKSGAQAGTIAAAKGTSLSPLALSFEDALISYQLLSQIGLAAENRLRAQIAGVGNAPWGVAVAAAKIIIDAGSVQVKFVGGIPAGAKLLKSAGKALPALMDGKTGRILKWARVASNGTKVASLAANAALVVIEVAHMISGYENAKRLKKIEGGVNRLVDAYESELKSRLEAIYRYSKELLYHGPDSLCVEDRRELHRRVRI